MRSYSEINQRMKSQFVIFPGHLSEDFEVQTLTKGSLEGRFILPSAYGEDAELQCILDHSS